MNQFSRSVHGAVALIGLLTAGAVSAAPVFLTTNAVLPGGLSTLQAERALFAANAAALGDASLSTEGFESFTAGNPVNFGAFTATLTSGTGFSQICGNILITTQGNCVIDFTTSGATSVAFTFGSPINAFGIDITSIDFPNTTVTFSDNLGNSLGGFVTPVSADAAFFGVTNSTPFTTARLSFGGSELLNFDNLQYGRASIPEPATLALLGVGLAGLAASRRRKTN